MAKEETKEQNKNVDEWGFPLAPETNPFLNVEAPSNNDFLNHKLLLNEGIDDSTVSFKWVHYKFIQTECADINRGGRGYQVVHKDMHGRMFQESAFDPESGRIVRGRHKDNPYELALCVRPRYLDALELQRFKKIEEDKKAKSLSEEALKASFSRAGIEIHDNQVMTSSSVNKRWS